ncbi:MAG: tetratricopeptide repeat protein [Phycisphaeraceae bacterium]|nr:tetratricopeptide repeat protein [Phycisphaeraceae bacterium]
MRRSIPCVVAVLLASGVAVPLAGCSGWKRERSEARARTAAERDKAAEAADFGNRLREQGLDEAALAEFERAIAINPTLTVAYLGAGEIYRQRGDYNTAEQRYAEAVRLSPSDFDANYGHGLTLQLLNRLSEAVRAYLRALAIRPLDFAANRDLGTAFLQLGEAAQGLPYAEQAVRVDPSDGPARVNLGAIYAALDRHADAITQYHYAAELMVMSPEIMLNLADSYGKVGRYDDMAATLREVIHQRPSAQAHERLGSAYFRAGHYDQALASFRAATAMDANHYPAHNGIAVCLLNRYLWSDRTDRAALDEALDALRRSLRIERNQPKIVELLTRYG